MNEYPINITTPLEKQIKIVLPCDFCGKELKCASFYLSAKSDRKTPKGFYFDLCVRLCEKCIDKIKKAFSKE